MRGVRGAFDLYIVFIFCRECLIVLSLIVGDLDFE